MLAMKLNGFAATAFPFSIQKLPVLPYDLCRTNFDQHFCCPKPPGQPSGNPLLRHCYTEDPALLSELNSSCQNTAPLNAMG